MGIFLFANVRYVVKIVKVENVTSAIMILTLTFSVFTAIGNFLFGKLLKTLDYSLAVPYSCWHHRFGICRYTDVFPETNKIQEQTINLLNNANRYCKFKYEVKKCG